MPDGCHPVMHSDMGWQYQHEAYRSRLEEAGIVQSMFGHIKDEFSRNRTWPDFESFKADLEAYIIDWNTVRGQARLKGLTPEEFRISPNERHRPLISPSKNRGTVHNGIGV